MAFYIKKQAKVNNKWYPRSITVGKPVSTDNVADKLAEKLEDWWKAKGDRKTMMFDPADSLTSKIEGELSEIADNIEGICDQFRGGLSVNIISEDD